MNFKQQILEIIRNNGELFSKHVDVHQSQNLRKSATKQRFETSNYRNFGIQPPQKSSKKLEKCEACNNNCDSDTGTSVAMNKYINRTPGPSRGIQYM